MHSRHSTHRKALFNLLAVLLIFSPIFRAGNSPIPLMLLEWIALAVLALMVLDSRGLRHTPRFHLAIVVLILALPLLYLIPVPLSLWLQLPGREHYAGVLNAYAVGEAGQWRTISIIGSSTENALWALLPPLAAYVATINQRSRDIQKLIYVLVGMAVFQAILGLMQFGQGAGSALYFGSEYAGGSASGTYRNRDHFAGLMEMIFPVVLALLAVKVGRTKGHRSLRRPSWRYKLDFLSSLRGHQAVVYGLIAVLLILALVFTKSRAGVALAMVGLMLVLFAFFRRLGGDNTYGAYGTVVAIVVVLAIEIGLAPVLDRFSVDHLEDLRWTIYATSMEGVRDFAPLGSGQGTFPIVYPWYQLQEGNYFINRVHNDYLEWIFDGGLPTAAVLLLGIFLYFRNWAVLWIKGTWGTYRYIQVGAGIGVFLLMLHSFVDFNLHKPANAIYFAFFLAVFMKSNDEEQEKKSRKRREHTTRRMPVRPVAATPIPATPDPDAPDLSDW